MQILTQKVLDGARDSEFSTNCQMTLLLLLWGPVSFCGPVSGTWEQTWMGVSRERRAGVRRRPEASLWLF